MGDFHIYLLKMNSYDSNESYNNLNSHFFTPFILEPTRLHSNPLIDNIFFNTLEFQSLSGNLFFEISDLLIQFVILEGFVKKKMLSKN